MKNWFYTPFSLPEMMMIMGIMIIGMIRTIMSKGISGGQAAVREILAKQCP